MKSADSTREQIEIKVTQREPWNRCLDTPNMAYKKFVWGHMILILQKERIITQLRGEKYIVRHTLHLFSYLIACITLSIAYVGVCACLRNEAYRGDYATVIRTRVIRSKTSHTSGNLKVRFFGSLCNQFDKRTFRHFCLASWKKKKSNEKEEKFSRWDEQILWLIRNCKRTQCQVTYCNVDTDRV